MSTPDLNDDVATLRAAGYYSPGEDPDEDMPGNRPQAEPTYCEMVNRCHVAEAKVAILESFKASIPWADLETTLVCARHWTPSNLSGLNFVDDHLTFGRVDNWLYRNMPEETPNE